MLRLFLWKSTRLFSSQIVLRRGIQEWVFQVVFWRVSWFSSGGSKSASGSFSELRPVLGLWPLYAEEDGPRSCGLRRRCRRREGLFFPCRRWGFRVQPSTFLSRTGIPQVCRSFVLAPKFCRVEGFSAASRLWHLWWSYFFPPQVCEEPALGRPPPVSWRIWLSASSGRCPHTYSDLNNKSINIRKTLSERSRLLNHKTTPLIGSPV